MRHGCPSATDTLGCSEHIAKLYFETFLAVHSKPFTPASSAFSTALNSTQASGLQSKTQTPKPLLSVNAHEFSLFLALQLYAKHRSQTVTTSIDFTSSTPSANAQDESQDYVSFIVQHIVDLLMLVRDAPAPQLALSNRLSASPPQLNNSLMHQATGLRQHGANSTSTDAVDPSSVVLTATEVNRLSYLFYCFANEFPLHELASTQAEGQQQTLTSLMPFFATKRNSRIICTSAQNS